MRLLLGGALVGAGVASGIVEIALGAALIGLPGRWRNRRLAGIPGRHLAPRSIATTKGPTSCR